MSTLYTNTSKVSAVVGLVITTVAVTYAANHSDEIVNGIMKISKKGLNVANHVIHGRKLVPIMSYDMQGNSYDTGLKAWK